MFKILNAICFAFLLLVLSIVLPFSAQAEGQSLSQYLDPLREFELPEESMGYMVVQATPSKDPERFEIEDPPEKEVDRTQPMTPWLPIWGQEARDEGYDLPLPLGLSVNTMVQRQVPKVEDLKFGFGTPQARPNIDLDGSEVYNATALLRGDVWLFPFMSIYAFGGGITGKANININVRGFTVGGIPVNDFKLQIESEYSGVTGGLGTTLAGGYKQYFGSLDANHSKTKLDFLEGKLDVTTVTARTGILVDSEKYGNGSTWIGAMYLDLRERLQGSETVDPPGPLPPSQLNYDLVFTTDKPWSILAGGMWEFSKRYQAMVEVSYGGRTSLLGGFTVRF